MILFLSDLHLGRGTREETRRAEKDAIELLSSYRDSLRQPGSRVVFVGDVFNAYMEYRTLVPVGSVRLLGTIANLADESIPVTIITGNRDHWMLGHVGAETGARIVDGPWQVEAHGLRLLVAHGDEYAPGVARRAIRPALRSRLAYKLFRNAIPGDWGFRLAARLASLGRGELNSKVVDALRKSALSLLQDGRWDVVVFGHSHQVECSPLAGGTYMNPGYWFADRTFGVLDEEGLRVMRWMPDTKRATALHLG